MPRQRQQLLACLEVAPLVARLSSYRPCTWQCQLACTRLMATASSPSLAASHPMAASLAWACPACRLLWVSQGMAQGSLVASHQGWTPWVVPACAQACPCLACHSPPACHFPRSTLQSMQPTTSATWRPRRRRWQLPWLVVAQPAATQWTHRRVAGRCSTGRTASVTAVTTGTVTCPAAAAARTRTTARAAPRKTAPWASTGTGATAARTTVMATGGATAGATTAQATRCWRSSRPTRRASLSSRTCWATCTSSRWTSTARASSSRSWRWCRWRSWTRRSTRCCRASRCS
mmetsp:Transcript_37647/g.95109  ORF Transcript_37647/g.95109 Transcript_37647/m.95109 type:complete len:290 (+) Transcript_37647:1242-2111(+)